MIPTITKEQAVRTEHHPDCAGYEDCDCFHLQVSYRDLYDLQQQLRVLTEQVNRNQVLTHPLGEYEEFFQELSETQRNPSKWPMLPEGATLTICSLGESEEIPSADPGE